LVSKGASPPGRGAKESSLHIERAEGCIIRNRRVGLLTGSLGRVQAGFITSFFWLVGWLVGLWLHRQSEVVVDLHSSLPPCGISPLSYRSGSMCPTLTGNRLMRVVVVVSSRLLPAAAHDRPAVMYSVIRPSPCCVFPCRRLHNPTQPNSGEPFSFQPIPLLNANTPAHSTQPKSNHSVSSPYPVNVFLGPGGTIPNQSIPVSIPYPRSDPPQTNKKTDRGGGTYSDNSSE